MEGLEVLEIVRSQASNRPNKASGGKALRQVLRPMLRQMLRQMLRGILSY
jgi:hypothetical protein